MIENIKKNYFSNIKGDIFGGITAGVIALPLALAFGVASGLGAAAGLYGAILLGFFASIFGGTKSQVSGPTGPMTVVMASIAAMHPGHFQLFFFTVVLAGFFQIIFGVCKVGDLIKFVPYPVISGFMSGIGFIILILQLNPILGLPVQGNTVQSLFEIFSKIGMTNLHSVLLGLLTLFILFFTPKKVAKKLPPALIALIFVSLFSVLLKFNVPTIGAIPMGLPKFGLPLISFDLFLKIIPTALTLGILGSVDSLLTSLVADSLTKTKHLPNKELIGQGIGNIFAGLFGGVAGAGATMRTVVNIKAGGRTALSGVIHSLFLLTILLGAAPLAAYIPLSVLAGILIKVGVDIIDYKFIKLLNVAPKRDLAVMLLVFFTTVFYDLIFAVGAGIVLSSILFAVTVAKQFHVEVNDISYDEESLENTNIRIVDIDGVLFFGSVSRIVTGVDELLGTKCLILNCKTISNMDISAVFALEDIILRMKDENIKVLLVLKNKEATKKLSKLGLVKILGKENIFYTKDEAIVNAKTL